MIGPQPAPAGAMCAAHQDAAADSVCTRCGNFMCATCSERRQGSLCPSCRVAMGTWPLARDRYDFNQVWTLVYSAWKRDLVMLGLSAVIMSALGIVGQVVMQVFMGIAQTMMVSGAQSGGRTDAKALVPALIIMGIGVPVGLAVTILVQGIGIMGLIRVCMDGLLGRKVEVQRMFTQTKKIWQYALLQLALSFGVMVPMMLGMGLTFVVAVFAGGGSLSASGIETAFKSPAAFAVLALGFSAIMVGLVYVVIPLSLAQFELVYSGCGGIEALKRAWAMGAGHRLPIFGYSLIGGFIVLGLLLVGLAAFCVGVMVAAPIGYALLFMLQAGLFFTLRNGSGLPLPEAETT